MKIKNIAFVGIPVTDMKRAREFYEDVLALKIADQMMGGQWIEYVVGDNTLQSRMSVNSGRPRMRVLRPHLK